MKTDTITIKALVILLFVLFAAQSLICAGTVFGETIYTLDGEVIEGAITEEDDGMLWYEVETGDIIEEQGIDISDVDKILNDDGTVSEYSPIRTES